MSLLFSQADAHQDGTEQCPDTSLHIVWGLSEASELAEQELYTKNGCARESSNLATSEAVKSTTAQWQEALTEPKAEELVSAPDRFNYDGLKQHRPKM